MVRPFVFQVAGYQNSGKTTLAEELIRRLKEAGVDVASIKHHGHGGKPDIPSEKDSSRHIDAGASAALVEGNGRLILHSEKNAWPLEDQIRILSTFDPEAILIEGHKYASYPKIVLIRNREDEKGLLGLENIIAAAYWDTEPQTDAGFPFFSIKDNRTPENLTKLILEQMECQAPQN
ncbi:molybdopterin-guanine dinucleotide biosynthesis protein B [Neobacillus piezotolerans]|uniref:Molybdopterin-guanine dinucleotide biosynthesis protein B n=2 Tax=Neobacillus piezotolerans TaxID=2259171 RepID=A0A3D8GML5_9BACI|nr:molybdopterin-guanine dinucleotide biosynthesis protein B [Neobacillus piezotolerans]